MSDTRTPTFRQTLDDSFLGLMASVHTCMPARVTEYDPDLRKATVQPLVMHVYTDEEGSRITELYPAIPSVPVLFPGGGGFRVTYPIAIGEKVLVFFSDVSLDRWLSDGGEVDPQDDRRFHLTDAIALAGVQDFASALAAANDRMVLGMDSGHTINIDGTSVRIGSNDPGELEPAVKGNVFASIMSAIAGHTHPYTWSGSPGAGVTSVSGALASLPDARSASVKIKV